MSHRPNVAGDCDHNKYDRPSDGMAAAVAVASVSSHSETVVDLPVAFPPVLPVAGVPPLELEVPP